MASLVARNLHGPRAEDVDDPRDAVLADHDVGGAELAVEHVERGVHPVAQPVQRREPGEHVEKNARERTACSATGLRDAGALALGAGRSARSPRA